MATSKHAAGINLRKDYKEFLLFTIETSCGRSEAPHIRSDQVVSASINLLNHVPTARDAVLCFYGQIFDEFCAHHIATFYGSKDVQLGKYLALLKGGAKESNKTVRAGGYESPVKRVSVDRRPSAEGSSSGSAETPASPTPMESDQVMMGTADDEDDEDQHEILQSMIQRVGDALQDFNSRSSSRLLVEWSIERLCYLSVKYTEIRNHLAAAVNRDQATPDHNNLSETIEFWLKCSVISLLLNILKRSLESKRVGYNEVLEKLINYIPVLSTGDVDLRTSSVNNPKTDWICCYIITSIVTDDDGSEGTGGTSSSAFSSAIESLTCNSSLASNLTSILSYLSAHNPRAIISSSKSNMPQLLRLCRNSKPLLDVLAEEASKGLSIDYLNSLSSTLASDDEDLKQDILYCVMHAPNSFDLLMMSFDIASHADSSPQVKKQTLSVLNAIVFQMHKYVYAPRVQNPCLKFPILDDLKNHYEELIKHPSFESASHPELMGVQLKLLPLICVYYGFNFTTRVLFQMLCCTKTVSGNKRHPVLTSFLKSLRLPFGQKLKRIFIEIMSLPDEKNDNFWTHVTSFIETYDGYMRHEIDMDILTANLIDILQLQQIIGSECHTTVILMLKLMVVSMEKYPKLTCRPRHDLCLSLVVNYVSLVYHLEENEDEVHDVQSIMEIIVLSQKCMRCLSKNPGKGASGSSHLLSSLSSGKDISYNQHILTRAFLECIFEKNEKRSGDVETSGSKGLAELSLADVSLKEENMRDMGSQGSLKFRKIPLNPLKKHLFLRDREMLMSRSKLKSINIRNQLLYDGIRSCITNSKDGMHGFSLLLVELVTPDVMYNDASWPDEDFLKVTIERDLKIYRKFQNNPIIWDLLDMIASEHVIRDASVLIRAIMAVLLTQLASATASKQKSLSSTQRYAISSFLRHVDI